MGIELEYRPRIFERFYRVDKSCSPNICGTDLGLSIVKHAALIHNARIELAKQIGQGTVFKVIFPEVD